MLKFVDKNNLVTTTIKLSKSDYSTFQEECEFTGMNLQRLVNRSIYLYIADINFKKMIDNYTEFALVSGSAF